MHTDLKWSTRRFWKSWFIQDIKYIFYKYVYNIHFDNGLRPRKGKSIYYTIKRKYDIYDIIDNNKDEFLRLIPFKENHGFFIEVWNDNKMLSRSVVGYDILKKLGKGDVEIKH